MKKAAAFLRVCALAAIIALASSYCVYAQGGAEGDDVPTEYGADRCDMPEGEQTY